MGGLYVHIPFCESKCRYCGFYSEIVSGADTGRLVSAMLQEVCRYDISGVDTIYIGGGSPSCLPREELYSLIEAVTSKCERIAEFSVEVNPGQVDGGFLKGLAGRGVDRLSIGAQSFDDEELGVLGRGHDSVANLECFELARESGFVNISMDLIFAIPGCSIEKFDRSLDKVISLGCEHVSAYSLSIEPGTVFGRAFAEGRLAKADEETDLAMYERAIDKLETAGIYQYEISNFARPGFECRHNLGCWANEEYIGVGPGASSYYGGVRYSNIADIEGYINGINGGGSVICESYRPDMKERACETAVMNLRRRKGIAVEEFRLRTGFDVFEVFREIIGRFVKEGMLVHDKDAGRIYLSRKALPVADGVICEFASF